MRPYYHQKIIIELVNNGFIMKVPSSDFESSEGDYEYDAYLIEEEEDYVMPRKKALVRLLRCIVERFSPNGDHNMYNIDVNVVANEEFDLKEEKSLRVDMKDEEEIVKIDKEVISDFYMEDEFSRT